METVDEKSKNPLSEPEVLIDKAAQKIIDHLGKYPPIQRVRGSQVISALCGAIGFALFITGIEKLIGDLPGWISLGVGLTLMIVAGALFQKLNK